MLSPPVAEYNTFLNSGSQISFVVERCETINAIIIFGRVAHFSSTGDVPEKLKAPMIGAVIQFLRLQILLRLLESALFA